jgi:hypothetical protein
MGVSRYQMGETPRGDFAGRATDMGGGGPRGGALGVPGAGLGTASSRPGMVGGPGTFAQPSMPAAIGASRQPTMLGGGGPQTSFNRAMNVESGSRFMGNVGGIGSRAPIGSAAPTAGPAETAPPTPGRYTRKHGPPMGVERYQVAGSGAASVRNLNPQKGAERVGLTPAGSPLTWEQAQVHTQFDPSTTKGRMAGISDPADLAQKASESAWSRENRPASGYGVIANETIAHFRKHPDELAKLGQQPQLAPAPAGERGGGDQKPQAVGGPILAIGAAAPGLNAAQQFGQLFRAQQQGRAAGGGLAGMTPLTPGEKQRSKELGGMAPRFIEVAPPAGAVGKPAAAGDVAKPGAAGGAEPPKPEGGAEPPKPEGGAGVLGGFAKGLIGGALGGVGIQGGAVGPRGGRIVEQAGGTLRRMLGEELRHKREMTNNPDATLSGREYRKVQTRALEADRWAKLEAQGGWKHDPLVDATMAALAQEDALRSAVGERDPSDPRSVAPRATQVGAASVSRPGPQVRDMPDVGGGPGNVRPALTIPQVQAMGAARAHEYNARRLQEIQAEGRATGAAEDARRGAEGGRRELFNTLEGGRGRVNIPTPRNVMPAAGPLYDADHVRGGDPNYPRPDYNAFRRSMEMEAAGAVAGRPIRDYHEALGIKGREIERLEDLGHPQGAHGEYRIPRYPMGRHR